MSSSLAIKDERSTDWIRAASRLREKSLIREDSDESLSLRIPGREELLGGGFDQTPLPVSFSKTEPSFPASMLHVRIYGVRPDVGAILFSRQEWGSSLNDVREVIPGIFDEQVRQLGRSISPLRGLPSQIVTLNGNLATATVRQLRGGEQIFLVSGGVLILGHTVERVVFNAELLEKCSKAYLIARATGLSVKRVPFYVRFIANLRLRKDQKHSASSYAEGRIPDGFKAY